MTKPSGYVIYRGPSVLDGAPIVAIAITGSSNRKTGPMLQTYILREDIRPTEALKTGADASICGDCKHRPMLGGSCYVVVAQGPTVVWKTYKAGKYPVAPDIAELGKDRMVRLGTYGDPMAVPANIWRDLVAYAKGHTGYTHQWNNPAIPATQWRGVVDLCMASVDSDTEAVQARDAKLRYFRVRLANEPIGKREMICPASEEAGKRLTCSTCGACNGSNREGKASVAIIVHGSRKSNFGRIST